MDQAAEIGETLERDRERKRREKRALLRRTEGGRVWGEAAEGIERESAAVCQLCSAVITTITTVSSIILSNGRSYGKNDALFVFFFVLR